jgi:hypothetical protein
MFLYFFDWLDAGLVIPCRCFADMCCTCLVGWLLLAVASQICAVPTWLAGYSLPLLRGYVLYLLGWLVIPCRCFADIVKCAVPAWLDVDLALSNVSTLVCYWTTSNVSQPAKAHFYDIRALTGAQLLYSRVIAETSLPPKFQGLSL